MPSTYSPSLRINEQNTGENTNTWGALLNTGAFALIDAAIAGLTAITLSGNLTLTVNNGAADQARSAMLVLSGIGATITLPSVTKSYIVFNNTSGNVVFTTGSGTTCTLAKSTSSIIICDSSNCFKVTTDANDLANTLAAAEAYANTLAFESSSGNLPGQAGNAGNFLQTNGSNALWAPVPQASVATTWTALQTFSDGMAGTTLNLSGAAVLGSMESSGPVSGSTGSFSGPVTGASFTTGGLAINANIYGASSNTAYTIGTDPSGSSGAQIALYGSTAPGTPNTIFMGVGGSVVGKFNAGGLTVTGVGAFSGAVSGASYSGGPITGTTGNFSGEVLANGGLVAAGTALSQGSAFGVESADSGNYGAQWFMQNLSSGATNPNKYFRINPTGALEIVNSAYGSVIASLTDAGAFAAQSVNGLGAVTFSTSAPTGTPNTYDLWIQHS